jgi:hypothetical protein
MVLDLPLDDVCWESILEFVKNGWEVNVLHLLLPSFTSTGFPVLPGFGPAAELVAWRVPKGATIVVEQKDPKPVTPHPASFNGTDANFRRAVQLAPLKQGPPVDESLRPSGQTAGVGTWETNISLTQMKETGTIYSV